MSKVLKDPIKPMRRMNGKYPFDFKAPTYDNRTSSSMSAGDSYGTGFCVPHGKEKPGSIESGPIPQQSRCFSPKEIFYGEDKKG